MKSSLAPGLARTTRIAIDRDRTIGFLGEEGRVYSTPSMVRDVENCGLGLVGEHLDPGESSVGIRIAIDHLAATPLGSWVDVTVRVVGVDGRKVSLAAEVRDPLEAVGSGEHVRFVIDAARHKDRLKDKLTKLAGLEERE